MHLFTDRKVRLPRIWSNEELRKMAHFFSGRAVNVSGWEDRDKQGSTYQQYFVNVSDYHVSNYVSEAKGFQGRQANEFFLDLEDDLDENLIGKFDVVFNHTVLEHVFNCRKAFENICLLSRDIVIVVVPFIQHQHSAYGDFWRFTPECIARLFQIHGLELLYINYNDGRNQSVYVFAVAAKCPQNWQTIKNIEGNKIDRLTEKVGYRVVSQGPMVMLFNKIRKRLKSVKI